MAPLSGLVVRQFRSHQHLCQISADALSLAVWYQASKGSSILKEHKTDALIVGSVDTVSEIACRFRDADSDLFHKIILSDTTGGIKAPSHAKANEGPLLSSRV